MRRILTVVGALMLVAAFIPSTVNAQALGTEIMQGNVKDIGSNAFGCTTTTASGPCDIHHRIYPETAPNEINGPLLAADGWPRWRNTPQRYQGDSQGTNNYANGKNLACEPWYNVFDGAIGSDSSAYISYYSTQSQIINHGENGVSPNAVDCSGTGGTFACFGEATLAFGRGVSGSAQGALANLGGLSPVPVVSVAATAVSGTLQLSMDVPAPTNNLNLGSAQGVACPASAAFGDTDPAPSAVYGVGLYFYTTTATGPFRTLDNLEGAPLQTVLANPSSGMACDVATGAGCSSVFFLPCSSVVGATCAGEVLAPEAQSGTVDVLAIETAMGGALGANAVVFVTKVQYRGSLAGSQANSNNTGVNPSLVSLFSAASSKASFNALAARVDITSLTSRGNSVNVKWQTVGSSYVSFTVQRANDGVSFVELATVPATGESDYDYTDQIRGRRPNAATYRILAEDLDGNVTQVFESIDLSRGNGSRGR